MRRSRPLRLDATLTLLASLICRLFNWGGRLPLQPDIPVPLPAGHKDAHEPPEFDLRSEHSIEAHEWIATIHPEVVVALLRDANDAVVRILVRLLCGKMGMEDPTGEGTASMSDAEDQPRLQIFYDADSARMLKQIRVMIWQQIQKIKESWSEPQAAIPLLLSSQLDESV